ncbi:protein kinase C-binding protein NELL1-like isoform X2 [Leptopilina boulardi]|uniref:protein kinase C-binding protein NELL1-like isoform X2 n=1 Tax=Leptopilina boulardi TaxID=63433 RepID=UPI0021F666C1|nr:protein kinase C-binding protein NELL1-like isoform X2 [Leptopilina boulardi]XP_051159623.1 protein kinase C-binding protein NELL1-like isoform X2 [Leptopilina boulardi]
MSHILLPRNRILQYDYSPCQHCHCDNIFNTKGVNKYLFFKIVSCKHLKDFVNQVPRQQRHQNFYESFLLLAAAVYIFLVIFISEASGTIQESEGNSKKTAFNDSTELHDLKSTFQGDLSSIIDLLEALQLHNRTLQGVTQVPGLMRLKPAYYFEGEDRELRMSEKYFQQATSLLRQCTEFTMVAILRQEEANSGTIVAFSYGNNRYLELQSSGRKDELRLHYVSRQDGTIHVERFPYRLADGAWHKVALIISGSQVELLVDCHPLYRRLLRPGAPDTNFTKPFLQLWVGQRSTNHFLFKGALQDVKLIAGPHGYLYQCPQLDSSCPVCGHFLLLHKTVERVLYDLNELTLRLATAENIIRKLEDCECEKSCRVNGTIHDDGATWEKDCHQCSCVHGEIKCKLTPCAPVACKNPIVPIGHCCPVCLIDSFLSEGINSTRLSSCMKNLSFDICIQENSILEENNSSWVVFVIICCCSSKDHGSSD